MSELKQVKGTFRSGPTHWVGDGFPVRTVFPTHGINEIDPFLMLDYAAPTVVRPSARPRGVDEHPHRGFETVTIAYQGALEHRDSGGHSGTIGPGDVQWMTAASGLVHEEKYEREFAQRGGTLEMAQLWVNLPQIHKMSKPQHQTLLNNEIPVVQLGSAGYARVIAGELNGIKGLARTFTPINVWDVRLKGGTQTELSLPSGQNTGVVLLKGDVVLNSSQELKGEPQLALLDAAGECVSLDASRTPCCLFLAVSLLMSPGQLWAVRHEHTAGTQAGSGKLQGRQNGPLARRGPRDS
jgi:redox-sensitive bicupin YhaK (pirin superfamily)